MKIKGFEGCGMSYYGLDFARRMQLLHDIPDANVCFSPEELLKKVKKAEKGEKFIFIEGDKYNMFKRRWNIRQQKEYEQLKQLGWSNRKILEEITVTD